MRSGVLICERPCVGGYLNYKFGMSSLSVPEWGEGDFLTPQGPYQFKAVQGLVAEHIGCLNSPTCSMIMEIALNSVNDRRRPMSSYDWDDNSLHV